MHERIDRSTSAGDATPRDPVRAIVEAIERTAAETGHATAPGPSAGRTDRDQTVIVISRQGWRCTHAKAIAYVAHHPDDDGRYRVAFETDGQPNGFADIPRRPHPTMIQAMADHLVRGILTCRPPKEIADAR